MRKLGYFTEQVTSTLDSIITFRSILKHSLSLGEKSDSYFQQ